MKARKKMAKYLKSFKRIAGSAVMLTAFGLLYLTGWHTEAIAQIHRLVLTTGIHQADVRQVKDESPVGHVPLKTFPGAGFSMQDQHGKTVEFEELKGKVIFLNIWASWCAPCIAEMPNIQSLYEKIHSDEIAFVMLSVDQEDKGKVKKFIDRKGFSFPVYLPADPLPEVFSTGSIATTFIISPKGEIVHTQKGMAEYDTPEMRAFLQGLAEK